MSQQQQQCYLMVRLYQASASTLQQLCNDASDSVLIEINGDAWKLFTNQFWSVIAELLQLNVELGSVYIKDQHQCCDNSAMMLVILFSLKSMETVGN